jgi:3-deoxy-D-manno-octulosonate 8-phosphate phosphatase (KDO 8-P phosphatase)
MRQELYAKLRQVRLFVSDVDGTLTDGAMYFSAEGELFKRFHTRDGMAIELLHSAGLPTAFLTRENSPIVLARARKLGVHHVILGAVDKQFALSTLAQQLAVPLEAVAYIGDDLNDLPAIEIAGVSACPADAVPEVRSRVDYVCSAPGGFGAVREFAELILRAQGHQLEQLVRYGGVAVGASDERA